jgi:TetR/AcrR family transcriptional regulator
VASKRHIAGKPAKKRRKRGRPQGGQERVGSEVIIAAARKLLATLPPHKATNLLIARQAGVDPALVRYYFSSRQALILAVIENMIEEWVATHPSPDAGPAEQLAQHVAGMVDFARSARSMQRLMIDECAEAKSPEIRKRIREMNAEAVQVYAKLFDLDEPRHLEPVDPLFVFVAIIGMSELFVAAQAMIVPLLSHPTSANELAERYKRFIVKMVLDGLRPRTHNSDAAPSASP